MTEPDLSGTVAGLCFIGCGLLIVLILLTGCQPQATIEHQVTAPQLDKLFAPALGTQRVCAIPPLPNHFKLVVDSASVDADLGGLTVLRAYAAARECWVSH